MPFRSCGSLARPSLSRRFAPANAIYRSNILKIDRAALLSGCGRERSRPPIVRADTFILMQYLFSAVGWIICLPRAGRPSDRPATFTTEENFSMKTTTASLSCRGSRAGSLPRLRLPDRSVLLSVSNGNAFSSARSAFEAGCIGPTGAVGVNRRRGGRGTLWQHLRQSPRLGLLQPAHLPLSEGMIAIASMAAARDKGNRGRPEQVLRASSHQGDGFAVLTNANIGPR